MGRTGCVPVYFSAGQLLSRTEEHACSECSGFDRGISGVPDHLRSVSVNEEAAMGGRNFILSALVFTMYFSGGLIPSYILHIPKYYPSAEDVLFTGAVNYGPTRQVQGKK